MKTARKKPRPPKTATGMAGAGPDRPFPSREQIRAFLAETPGRVGKREAMRAFGLGPEHRVAMRTVLKEMAARGEAAPAGHKRFTAPHGAPRLTGSLGRSAGGRLPEAIIVEITGIDSEGDAIARPAEWRGDGPAPTIFMQPEARGQTALAPGQRVLARIKPIGEARGARKFEGRTLRRIEGTPGRVIGIFRRRGGLTRIEPTDKKVKAEWIVPPGEDGGAEDGEIVRGEPLPMGGLGLKPVRVVERLGDAGSARAVSLLVIATLDIPDAFTPEVLAEAERARGVGPEGREDLRDIPLVTIDGADARDFDDAVFAEPERVRLPADRGDRRCRALRAAGQRARPLGAGTRQLGLFPRPGGADAARGALQRLVQPAPQRGPRLPFRRDAHRQRWPEGLAPLRARPDAQRRAPDL